MQQVHIWVISLSILAACAKPPTSAFPPSVADEDRAACIGAPLQNPTQLQAKACLRAVQFLQTCHYFDPPGDRSGLSMRALSGGAVHADEECQDNSYFAGEKGPLLEQVVKVLDAYCQAEPRPEEERGTRGATCERAGRAYRDGTKVPSDPERGLKLFDRGCQGGSAEACYLQALMIRQGKGTAPDGNRAAALVAKACQMARKVNPEASTGPCTDPDTRASLRGASSSGKVSSTTSSGDQPEYIVPPTVTRNDKDARCQQAITDAFDSCVRYCEGLGPGNVAACKSTCESRRDNRDMERRRGFPVDLGDDKRCR